MISSEKIQTEDWLDFEATTLQSQISREAEVLNQEAIMDEEDDELNEKRDLGIQWAMCNQDCIILGDNMCTSTDHMSGTCYTPNENAVR